MKANTIKIHGAISELNSSRSNVKHLVEESLQNEILSVKEDVLSEINSMFNTIENFLRFLMQTDLADEWQKEGA